MVSPRHGFGKEYPECLVTPMPNPWFPQATDSACKAEQKACASSFPNTFVVHSRRVRRHASWRPMPYGESQCDSDSKAGQRARLAGLRLGVILITPPSTWLPVTTTELRQGFSETPADGEKRVRDLLEALRSEFMRTFEDRICVLTFSFFIFCARPAR